MASCLMPLALPVVDREEGSEWVRWRVVLPELSLPVQSSLHWSCSSLPNDESRDRYVDLPSSSAQRKRQRDDTDTPFCSAMQTARPNLWTGTTRPAPRPGDPIPTRPLRNHRPSRHIRIRQRSIARVRIPSPTENIDLPPRGLRDCLWHSSTRWTDTIGRIANRSDWAISNLDPGQTKAAYPSHPTLAPEGGDQVPHHLLKLAVAGMATEGRSTWSIRTEVGTSTLPCRKVEPRSSSSRRITRVRAVVEVEVMQRPGRRMVVEANKVLRQGTRNPDSHSDPPFPRDVPSTDRIWRITLLLHRYTHSLAPALDLDCPPRALSRPILFRFFVLPTIPSYRSINQPTNQTRSLAHLIWVPGGL